MASATKTQRDETLRSLTGQVAYFDPSNPVHNAHWHALRSAFGEIGAAMLVSQDAARAYPIAVASGGTPELELTDPGEIASHPGWKARNRVVRHGEKARYTIFDFDADTKVGGRVVKLFTRDQTVPAYAQPE